MRIRLWLVVAAVVGVVLAAGCPGPVMEQTLTSMVTPVDAGEPSQDTTGQSASPDPASESPMEEQTDPPDTTEDEDTTEQSASPDPSSAEAGDLMSIMAALPDDNSWARARALVAQLNDHPQYEAAGLNHDGSVWARLADGEPIGIIFVDLAADKSPTRERITAQLVGESGEDSSSGKTRGLMQQIDFYPPDCTYELPAGSAAWVLRGPHVSKSGATPWLDDYARWMEQAGYEVRDVRDADLATLSSISDAAILHFDTHGMSMQHADGTPFYTVCTTVPTSVGLDRFKLSKEKDGIYRMPLEVKLDSGEKKIVWYWAISGEFVRRHISFVPDALVSIAACSSQHEDAMSFKQACWGKNASTYLGWTNGVETRDLVKASDFFFYHTLGINETGAVIPHVPPMRPLSVLETIDGMSSHKKDWDNMPYFAAYWTDKETNFAWVTEFRASARPAEDGGRPRFTGALAPPVHKLEIDEGADRLIIHGNLGYPVLGTRVERGRVMVGGEDLSENISVWDGDKIVVDSLPRQACGEVQVWVGTAPSNKRWITVWRDVVISRTSHGRGTRFDIATCEFPVIRADIMTSRSNYGPPGKHAVPFSIIPTQDARFSWDLGGTYTDADGTSVWSKGPGPAPVYTTEGPLESGTFFARVTLTASEVSFDCYASVPAGGHDTYTSRFGWTSENDFLVPFVIRVPVAGYFQIPVTDFVFDGGSWPEHGDDYLQWSVGDIEYLPPEDAPR